MSEMPVFNMQPTVKSSIDSAPADSPAYFAVLD